MPDEARHLLGLAARRERRTGGQAFDLAAFPEVVRVYAEQASAAEEIQRQARTAVQIDVLAVRGLGLLGLNDSLLRTSLTRPDMPPTVRVLLLDPDGPAAAARAAEIGESPDSMASGIRLTEARLRELVGVCSGFQWPHCSGFRWPHLRVRRRGENSCSRCVFWFEHRPAGGATRIRNPGARKPRYRQVGTCDMRVYRYGGLPTWRLVRLGSALYMSAFDAGWEGHESAVYKIMATSSGPLFRGFSRMFESTVNAGERTV